MAGSKFAYVKNFELPDPLLPNTFILIRIDGHGFHRLSEDHSFTKPNDERALQLMDQAARNVMQEFNDIVLAFGESDEYSFLFRKSTTVHNRRQSKILTMVTSLFTSAYVFNWPKFLPDKALKYPPAFDGRIVLYPSTQEVKDYFAWRQADTHINNLYNTVFWALVQEGGESTTQAHDTLRGTVSKQKHELLFSRFGINYNTLSERFKKGSVLVREEIPTVLAEPEKATRNENNFTEPHGYSQDTITVEHSKTQPSTKARKGKEKLRTTVELLHCDIIQDDFWSKRSHLLRN